MLFLASCSSFYDTEDMIELCNSYKVFLEKTEFIYDYDYSLNKEDAETILIYASDLTNKLNTYIENTDNIFFDRLSSSTETLQKLTDTTYELEKLLKDISLNHIIINEKTINKFSVLLNKIHTSMYSIEYDRVITSESIISDYIKYFLIFIIFFFVLCLVLLIIFISELKQRDFKIIETSKFLDYTIKGQEEEKKHIARELHDTVAQDIRYIIQLIKQLPQSDDVENILKNQERCLKQVRELCSSFIPQDIENKDIVASLNDIFTKIKTETDIEIKLTILDNINFKDMTNERFLHFFRIIQESLTNAQKHSKASEISVLIKKEVIDDISYIHLIITDDGIGIDKHILDSIQKHGIITSKKHFGLKNIIQRVQLLGGEIKFTSSKEFGTEINVIFRELEPGKNKR